jgi:hypothetical protein
MGGLTRIKLGRQRQRSSYAEEFVRSAELATRARAVAAAHEPKQKEPVPKAPADRNVEELVAPRIEAAVEEGLRRLHEEAERLRVATEEHFAELERELRAAEESLASELRRSQASVEQHLAAQSGELAAASERQAELASRLAVGFTRLCRREAASSLAEIEAGIRRVAETGD